MAPDVGGMGSVVHVNVAFFLSCVNTGAPPDTCGVNQHTVDLRDKRSSNWSWRQSSREGGGFSEPKMAFRVGSSA